MPLQFNEATLATYDFGNAYSQYELDLRRGKAKAISRYSDNPNAQLEMIAIEIAYQIEEGREVDIKDYQEKYPHFHSSIESIYKQERKREEASIPIEELRLVDPAISNDLQISVASKFKIHEKIGSGGMGQVYRAENIESGQILALKAMNRKNIAYLERLKAEFRSIADVSHPNLIQFYELFISEECAFLTMELLSGKDLLSYVWESRDYSKSGVNIERLSHSLIQVAEGLHALHLSGLVHRDIKPSNIIVEENDRAVLLDFGLVQNLDSIRKAGEQEASLAGTFEYMSPEQLAQESLTEASDWYSFGIILHVALVGSFPQGGSERHSAPHQGISNPKRARLLQLAGDLLNPEPSRRPQFEEIAKRLNNCSKKAGSVSLAEQTSEAKIFVGRSEELKILSSTLESISHGGLKLVRVTGESGIGKTALINRFLETQSDSRKCIVLSSRCHPHESIPFKALDGIIDDVFNRLKTSTGDFSSLLDSVAEQDLATVFPIFKTLFRSKSSSHGDPYRKRRNAAKALWTLISGIQADGKLIVWIDDLQWTDEDSMEVLIEGFSRYESHGILFILSYRLEDESSIADPIESLIARLSSKDCLSIAVGPLDRADSLNLMRGIVNSDLGPSEDALDLPKGSPFWIREMAIAIKNTQRHRFESKNSVQKDQLNSIIESRLNGLPSDAETLLEFASIAAEPLSSRSLIATAKLDPSAESSINILRKRMLIRPRGREGAVKYSPYHDKIGEWAESRLSKDALIERHAALADSLSKENSVTPGSLAYHFHGAGRLSQASDYAIRAAEDAMTKLSFAQAARFYSNSLDWFPGQHPRRGELLLKKADALKYAGRIIESADAYQEVTSLSVFNTYELIIEIAEQRMTGGQVDKGLDILKPLFSKYRIKIPTSPVKLNFELMRLLVLARIGMRKIAKSSQSKTGRKDTDRLIRLCYITSKGLMAVTPILGVYFALKGLVVSEKAGNRYQAGVGLTMVGMGLAQSRGFLSKWAQQMLQLANEIAIGSGYPYLQSFNRMMLGAQDMVDCRWKRLVENNKKAIEQFKTECRGTTWEINLAMMGVLRGTEEIGDYDEAIKLCAEWLRDCKSRGDLYGQINALLLRASQSLYIGEFEQATRFSRQAIVLYSRNEYSMNHFYADRIDILVKSIRGQTEEATIRLKTVWAHLESQNLHQTPIIRDDALILRGRVELEALSYPSKTTVEEKSLLVTIHQLLNAQRPHGVAFANLFLSCVHFMKREMTQAIHTAELSRSTFEKMGMKDATKSLNTHICYLDTGKIQSLKAKGTPIPMFLRIFAPIYRRDS